MRGLIMRTSLLCRFLKTAPLLVVLLFLTHRLAQAHQTPPPPNAYQPEIAYASNKGTTYSIYVANADGTNAVAVYSNKGVGASSLSFAPGRGNGSGQLVFIELYSVKLLTFNVTASGVTTSSVVTLATEPTLVHYVNVSPATTAGQFVLYGVGHPDNTTTIKVISIAGGQPISVATGYLGDATWSRDLTRIAVLIGNPDAAGVVQQIEMWALDSNFVAGTATVIYGPLSCNGCLNNLQFARTSDHVIFDGGLGVINEIDADSPSAATPFAVSGYQACFNHDDTEIIFRRFSDSHIFVYDISTMIQTPVTPGAAASPDFRVWSP
jgi:hypothetical protein